MQQILFSQFSDDEVEIVYLNRDKFAEAYGAAPVDVREHNSDYEQGYGHEPNSEEMFVAMHNKQQAGEYQMHGGGSRYAIEPLKRSIRRKLSLSSISHMWR